MTYNNYSVSVILGEQFNLEMIVTQRSKEATKTPEGLTVSLPVAISETQNNTEVIGSMDRRVELKKTVTR